MALSNRSLQKIESIKLAAKNLFNQYGYNHVTMDDIIQHSNVSRGTVYKYFTDKQDLYETIIKDIYDMERNQFNQILENNQNFKNKLEEIISVRVEKHTITHKKFFEDHYIRSNQLEEYMTNYSNEIKEMRHNLYNIGRREGIISEDISDKTLRLYLDLFQLGLSSKYHDLSRLTKEELTNVLTLVYSGMITCKK